MSLTELVVSLTLLIGTIVIPVKRATRAPIALAFLLAAPFVLALSTPERESLSRIASGLRIGAIASFGWQVVVHLVTIPLAQQRQRRAVIFGAFGLIALVICHNLLAFDSLARLSTAETFAINPWAFFKIMVVILFCITTLSTWKNDDVLSSTNIIIVTASAAVFLFQLAIAAGLLTGNTMKYADEIGGTGLGNMSTNETASLGVGLLIWNFRLLQRGIGRAALFSWASILCVMAAIILTKSRIGIATATVVLISLLVAGKIRTGFKLGVVAPLTIVAVVMAAQIVEQRSNSEITYWRGSLSISEGWGSGRGAFWSEYLDAFVDTASVNATAGALGVGPAGILPLYDLTRLREYGFVLADAEFYPPHSDVLTIVFTCGGLGLLAWLCVVIGMIRLPFAKGLSAPAYCAIGAFVVVSTGDMLSYVPEIAALLVTAVASCVSPHVAMNRRSQVPVPQPPALIHVTVSEAVPR
jgi:hypothetical protein